MTDESDLGPGDGGSIPIRGREFLINNIELRAAPASFSSATSNHLKPRPRRCGCCPVRQKQGSI